MERKYKIAIPKPCHENWDEMTSKENGRFCLSCSKTVVDFTAMLSDEIQHFFTQNQDNRICGRFKKTQLDTITIEIPNHILYKQKSYHKMFLLALFIVMGTTLFSCADKEGNKQKIEKVEVVENPKKEHIQVGDIKIKNIDTNNIPPPPPPKIDQVKFVKSEENSILDEKQAQDSKKKSSHPANSLKSATANNMKNSFSKKEIASKGEVPLNKNAELPGGIDQFYTFFENEYKRPENTSKLKIKISFAVEKNGSASYLQSEPPVEKNVETEIIRVLSLSPKWQPGESNGKKIKMQYSLPIVLQ